MEVQMSRPHKELSNSLRFQVSLLKLAMIPHGKPRSSPASNAAKELTKLATKVSQSARRQRT
jgi:hypothetical protein